jgi:NADH:ubiquinone oxidoreductase subunit 3 (subunit A)
MADKMNRKVIIVLIIIIVIMALCIFGLIKVFKELDEYRMKRYKNKSINDYYSCVKINK